MKPDEPLLQMPKDLYLMENAAKSGEARKLVGHGLPVGTCHITDAQRGQILSKLKSHTQAQGDTVPDVFQVMMEAFESHERNPKVNALRDNEAQVALDVMQEVTAISSIAFAVLTQYVLPRSFLAYPPAMTECTARSSLNSLVVLSVVECKS